ncbi:MAG: hypothetical protein QGG48_06345, partial [Desulfatiglandales bacterium]|nr:hypothetical protein [Desulfatiglandales bacterium]
PPPPSHSLLKHPVFLFGTDKKGPLPTPLANLQELDHKFGGYLCNPIGIIMGVNRLNWKDVSLYSVDLKITGHPEKKAPVRDSFP